MTDSRIGKAGHNLKYDYLMLKRAGLTVSPLTFDTMIAEWLINPASRNLGLKSLAWVRLGYEMTHIEELIGKGKAQITMDDVPIAEAAGYAAADAAIVLRLIPQLKEELQTQAAESLFKTMEMPLIPVLAKMEETGILLDRDFFTRFSKELENRLAEIEEQIFTDVGYTFNLNSTQQLSEALFDKLGLEPPDRTKKTSSGFYSTAAGVLEGMAGQHPVIDLVLEYRELEKLRSTYVDSLPSQINPETGRVHTSLNQTGTVTGRIASSNPNLQNIPTRTKTGQRWCATGSSPGRAGSFWRWTTRRLSFGLWRTWPRTRRCWRRFVPGRTSMPPRRPPCTASRSMRSRRKCAATPRRSTLA